MKQAESPAHSSGRSGGDRRVFDRPAAGVLQKMPIATDRTGSPRGVRGSRDGRALRTATPVNDERAIPFRHFKTLRGGVTPRTQFRGSELLFLLAERADETAAPAFSRDEEAPGRLVIGDAVEHVLLARGDLLLVGVIHRAPKRAHVGA